MRDLVAVTVLVLASAALAADKPDCKAQAADLAQYLKLAAEKPAENKPPESSIHRELEDLTRPPDPNQKASPPVTKKNTLPEKVFKKCRQVTRWMPSLAPLEPQAYKERLVADLPKRVEECKCQVELAAVKELSWFWLMTFEPAP